MSSTATAKVPQPPEGPHNWGRWGADDERGSLNLLGPDTVLAAAACIRTGQVFPLGIPVQSSGVPVVPYKGIPMRLTLQDGTDDGTVPAALGCAVGTGSHNDYLSMPSHTTSHMDALVHVYGRYSHYNGVGFDTMRALGGAQRLGIEKVRGFAARAVLLDLVAYLGDAEEWVARDRLLTAADLAGAAERQGVEVGAGDVVLVRTGYIQDWWANGEGTGQPGIGLDAARWLAARDVVAVGSDNAAVEALPFDTGDFLAVHKYLLVDHGIYLLEYLDLSEPARAGVSEGLLTVAPLLVTGATGSPVNPILIA